MIALFFVAVACPKEELASIPNGFAALLTTPPTKLPIIPPTAVPTPGAKSVPIIAPTVPEVAITTLLAATAP